MLGETRPWSLAGKTVLITGAAREIGAETARRLHAQGAYVSLVGIEPHLLADLTDDLMGVWRTVHATLPYVIESRGHITLIASIYAFLNGALNASYAMSKAGVEQFGRALRVELAGSGATAGVAYFGFVDTDMVSHAFAQPAAAALRAALPAFLTKPIPLGDAVDKLVAGIEHRRGRVTAPAWVSPAFFGRGPGVLLDAYLMRSRKVREATRVATINAAHG